MAFGSDECVANGTKKALVTQQSVNTILQALNRVNIITIKQNITIGDMSFVSFAKQYQLTSYDASYLYIAKIAKIEKIPMATLDKKLIQVASDIGLFLSGMIKISIKNKL